MDHVVDCENRLRTLHDGDPGVASALNELAKARWVAWQACGDAALLDAALDDLRQAIRLTEDDQVEESHRYRNNLGVFLFERAGQYGDRACDDLRESVDVLQIAISSSMPARNLHCTLHLNLANSLNSLYDLNHDMELLDRSIQTYEDGLDRVMTPGNMPKLFGGLSSAILSRFSRTRVPFDLDAALQSGEQSVLHSDEFHPYWGTFLDTYANVHFAAFQARHDEQHLEEAIRLSQSAVAVSIGSVKWPQFLSNQASYLTARSRVQANSICGLGDIDYAIELLEQILGENGATSNSVRSISLYRYALALRYRFERRGSGAEDDLSTALTILEDMLSDPSSATMDMQRSCTVEIANVLIQRFYVRGGPDDIDNAVKYLRDVSVTLSDHDPQLAADCFANLSVALLARFELRGSIDDLSDAEDAALASSNIILELPDNPDSAGSCVRLANVYLRTFQATGVQDHLDEAIRQYECAADDVNPRTMLLRPGRLATLGYALQLRCGMRKDTNEEDWRRCLQVCNEALQHSKGKTPARMPADQESEGDCWIYKGHLGSAYLEKFKAADDHQSSATRVTDLKVAIQHLEEACDHAPRDHISRALFLNSLGLAHELLFNEDSEDKLEYDLAVRRYKECSNMDAAPKLIRITAAYGGLRLAARLDLHVAAEFAELIIELLPTLSPRLVSREDQEYLTTVFAGLGSYSASVLLAAGHQPSKALLALEATRGIMTGLTIDTRQDLAALERTKPALAAEYYALSRLLDPPASLSVPGIGLINERLGNDARIKAGKRFAALIQEIRSVDGLETFLAPPTESELRDLAGESFIVVINITSLRSDALCVTKDSIRCIRLKDVVFDDVVTQANTLTKALKKHTNTRHRQTNKTLREVLPWLWQTIVGPIYQALPVAEGQKLRICWMPIGIMSFFPLHAATSKTQPSQNALDLIISSYGTTFKSLRASRANAARAVQNRAALSTLMKATLVSMSTTPGNHADLEFASKEVSSLELTLQSSSRFHAKSFPQPTKAELLLILEDTAVLHMSCHGIALRDDPSSSHLLLQDWQEDRLTVADLAAHRLPHAQFCYLSACHAASNLAPELLDESIHLASAMQLAGFPHVVGTLWKIDDRRAMEVSTRFWEALLARSAEQVGVGDQGVDFGGTAEALNAATIELRERTRRVEGSEDELIDDQPFIWSPFIHVGL